MARAKLMLGARVRLPPQQYERAVKSRLPRLLRALLLAVVIVDSQGKTLQANALAGSLLSRLGLCHGDPVPARSR